MVCKEEEKKLSDTEDLLEDLGRATDKVLEQQKKSIMLTIFSSSAITLKGLFTIFLSIVQISYFG